MAEGSRETRGEEGVPIMVSALTPRPSGLRCFIFKYHMHLNRGITRNKLNLVLLKVKKNPQHVVCSEVA